MHRTLLGMLVTLPVLGLCASAGASTVTLTKVGNPIWQPVDATLFSAPGALDLTSADQTALKLLGSKYVVNSTNSQIISAGNNPGPYNTDISSGAAANHFTLGPNFQATDFSGGNGAWTAFMFVPAAGAPTGSSPDFASGAIIPNSLFPFVQTGDTTRNGADFDPNWGATIPNVNAVYQQGSTPPNFDGFSHIPFFDIEAQEYGPGVGPAGNYASSWTMLDAQGNGWTISTSYTVVPEPLMIGLLGYAATMALGRRRSTAARSS